MLFSLNLIVVMSVLAIAALFAALCVVNIVLND